MRRFFVTMSGANRILRVCQVDASRLCNVNIVAAMSEESVMKQALSPEKARVRRGQLRALTLGIGASALAMACSFGEIDGEENPHFWLDPSLVEQHYLPAIRDSLARLIPFGGKALQHALTEYTTHYHHERNHQGKGNVLLLPPVHQDTERAGPMRGRERLGGLLKYYTREAA